MSVRGGDVGGIDQELLNKCKKKDSLPVYSTL